MSPAGPERGDSPRGLPRLPPERPFQPALTERRPSGPRALCPHGATGRRRQPAPGRQCPLGLPWARPASRCRGPAAPAPAPRLFSAAAAPAPPRCSPRAPPPAAGCSPLAPPPPAAELRTQDGRRVSFGLRRRPAFASRFPSLAGLGEQHWRDHPASGARCRGARGQAAGELGGPGKGEARWALQDRGLFRPRRRSAPGPDPAARSPGARRAYTLGRRRPGQGADEAGGAGPAVAGWASLCLRRESAAVGGGRGPGRAGARSRAALPVCAGGGGGRVWGPTGCRGCGLRSVPPDAAGASPLGRRARGRRRRGWGRAVAGAGAAPSARTVPPPPRPGRVVT